MGKQTEGFGGATKTPECWSCAIRWIRGGHWKTKKKPLGNTIIVKRQGCNIHICTVLYCSTCYEMSCPRMHGCMDGCFKFQHIYSHHNWAPGQEDQGSPHLPQNRAHLGHVDHLPPGWRDGSRSSSDFAARVIRVTPRGRRPLCLKHLVTVGHV